MAYMTDGEVMVPLGTGGDHTSYLQALELHSSQFCHGRCQKHARYACRQSKSDRAAMAYMEEGEVMVPLDAMGDTYQRLARHRRMGKYVQVSARCADCT